MEIKLTADGWADLKRMVTLGAQAERRLGLPVEVINGDSKIEIDRDGSAKIVVDGEV